MHNPRINTLALLLPLLGGWSCCGCLSPATSHAPASPAEPAPPPPDQQQAAPPATAPPEQLLLHFDVLRIDAPQEVRAELEKVWNHFDEGTIPYNEARHLNLNGLRVGVADEAAWPAVKAILDHTAGVEAMGIAHAQQDVAAWAIEIDPLARDRTVFYYGPSGSLVGSSFAAARALLRVEPEVSPADPQHFTVRLTPEIRQTGGETQLAATETGLREVPVYHGRVFAELTVALDVKQGDMILLAADHRAAGGMLLGFDMLRTQRADGRFDRLLLITPKLVAQRRYAESLSTQ